MKLPIRSVFICLRPEIFGHKDEHITLEYLGHDKTWDDISDAVHHWLGAFNGTPVTVRVNGYANWLSQQNMYYSVALVEFRDFPKLSYSKNWHITLESSVKPVKPRQYDADSDAFRYDYCDRLWVGYTDADGNKQYSELGELMDLEIEVAKNA